MISGPGVGAQEEARPKPNERLEQSRRQEKDAAAGKGEDRQDIGAGMEKRKEELLKNLSRMIEDSKKAAEAKRKKEESRKAAEGGDGRKVEVIDSTDGSFFEIDSEKKRGEREKIRYPLVMDSEEQERKRKSGGRMVEITGSRKSDSIRAVDEFVQIPRAGGEKLPILGQPGGEKEAFRAAQAGGEGSFFDRIFGERGAGQKDQEKKKGGPIELHRKGEEGFGKMATGPGAAGASVLARLKAELAAMRLKDTPPETNRRGEGAQEGQKAGVVDLDRPRLTRDVPSSLAGPKAQVVEPPPEPAPEKTAEEWKREAEERYQKGLDSKDVLAREWSFRYARAFGRKEAIPRLIQEIKQFRLLAPLAAETLGVLWDGVEKGGGEIEKALLGGLEHQDAALRLACVDSAGRLRLARTVKPLLAKLDTEKNYQIRCAVCDALGLIGEREAAGRLRAVLHDPHETELVQANAALALARLGDPGGKERLQNALSSPRPDLQIMALAGLAKLGGPERAGHIAMALESPFPEVWTQALFYLPELDPAQTLPFLRARLQLPNPSLRRKAALGLGFAGSDEGVEYIREAVAGESVIERQLGIGILGMLGCRQEIPLIVSALRDPHGIVRQAAAITLVRLEAKEAIPPLTECINQALAPRPTLPHQPSEPMDAGELATLLACLRILQGAEDTLALKNMPNLKEQRWPEFEKEFLDHQLSLVKTCQLLDVLSDGRGVVGAVIRDPRGQEGLFKPGEEVALGFVLRDLVPAKQEEGQTKSKPWVTLVRGDLRLTLAVGGPPEVYIGRQTKKKLGIKETAPKAPPQK